MVLRAELDLAICKRLLVGRKVAMVSYIHMIIAKVPEGSQTRYVGSANLSSASASDGRASWSQGKESESTYLSTDRLFSLTPIRCTSEIQSLLSSPKRCMSKRSLLTKSKSFATTPQNGQKTSYPPMVRM